MNRPTILVALALVVASVGAVPLSGLAATGGPVAADGDAATNGTGNATVAPGQQLSGVVGVQQAELEGDVESRAFGLQVARAASENATAGVVAAQFDSIEERLSHLEERRANLAEARANGSMNHGRYAVEAAELATRSQTLRQLANQTDDTARGLPAERLEARGINATAIQRLHQRASDLAGSEIADVARAITGPHATPGHGPPDDRHGGHGGQGQHQGDDTDSRSGGGDGHTVTATPTDTQ